MKQINIKQAVIFAGGKGLRLRPITDSFPKPMVLIHGAPFLDYLIKSIYDAGINNILILTGYKSEVLEEYYKKRRIGNINIQFSKGEVNFRTGKRLINAYEKLDPYFLLLYGYHKNYMGNIVHLKMDFNKIIICLKGKVKNEI